MRLAILANWIVPTVFAKLKALLRKAAERAIGSVWNRIGGILNALKLDECPRYLAHAGYGPL